MLKQGCLRVGSFDPFLPLTAVDWNPFIIAKGAPVSKLEAMTAALAWRKPRYPAVACKFSCAG